MALNYRIFSQSCRIHQLSGIFNTRFKVNSSLIRSASSQSCPESFAERNKRLKRPLSPFIVNLKPELTWVLSICHRGTGMALAGYAMAAGITELFLPGGMGCLIQTIAALNLSAPVLFLGKLVVAFPATYHYFNGIRHLLWDLGLFLTIKGVYKTGYAVVGISTVSALVLSAMI